MEVPIGKSSVYIYIYMHVYIYACIHIYAYIAMFGYRRGIFKSSIFLGCQTHGLETHHLIPRFSPIFTLSINRHCSLLTKGIWPMRIKMLPSGKRLHSYGKSPCLMGKSTISTGLCSIAILTFHQRQKWGHQPWFYMYYSNLEYLHMGPKT